MRFCHITTFYPPWNFGGDGILVRQICEGLARRGHEVDVVHCIDAFRLKGKQAGPAGGDPRNLRRHGLKSPWGAVSPLITQQTGRPGPKRASLEAILAADYDVVHFHNISLVGGPGVLEMSRAPVTLYTTHDHWLVCPAHVLWKYRSRPCDGPQCFSCSLVSGIPPQLWRYGGLLSRCLEHVDRILAPSGFTAERHRAAGIERPIEVLHSFSAPVGGEQAMPQRPELPRFVYAGRLEVSKGVQDLLPVFRTRPQYELLIAGDGRLARQLREGSADTPNIHVLGPLPHEEVGSLYRGAMAVISPAWGPETFHLVSVEAMSCGTPVIGRRAGGSDEVIEKTGGGLVYDSPDQLAPLLDRLAGDRRLRMQLAERALEGYRRHYSEQRWMSRYFDVIHAIAREKGITLPDEA